MSEELLVVKPNRTLSYTIARLDRLISKILGEELKMHGISLPQFTMLSVIERRPGISNAKLAELSFTKPQSTTKIISELEEKQWITKSSDPSHGRRLLIQITPLGRSKVQQCHQLVQTIEMPMLATIDNEVNLVVKTNLEIMFNNLKDHRLTSLANGN